MVLTLQTLAFVIPLASLLFSFNAIASPLADDNAIIDVSAFGLHKRQDPGPSGTDPSGIQPEDEDDAEIAADGTGPLRSGNWSCGSNDDEQALTESKQAVPARPLYTNQATATWFQVSSASGSDNMASFTVFTTTTPQVTPIPAPNDTNQLQGGAPWNVDHIFELQVIGECFKGNRPYCSHDSSCLDRITNKI